MSRLRSMALGLALIVLSTVAGCVSVPTVGPIEEVGGQQPDCQNCVNVVPAPPQPGDDPRQIVVGYLRATSNYQPDYTTAKQFLTRSAAEIWSPEDSVSIYDGAPVETEAGIVLRGKLVGSLDSDRTYTAKSLALEYNFGVVREDGEWRIGKPPSGLMVQEFSFNSFYRPYQLFFIGKYFVGDGGALVPDSIYLPDLGDPANIASALMKALLDGPSEWLAPAVTSAIPPDTQLSVESVTITDGIAEVRLSGTLLTLSDPLRSLLAAQIVYTLKQAGGIRAVLITVNGQAYRVPESDPNSLAIAVDAIPRILEPVPFVTGNQLYAVEENRVGLVDETAEAPDVAPIAGHLGQGRFKIDSLAVSVTGTDVAAVTDGGTALRRASATTGADTTLLEGVGNLLRPQFTRYDEVWAIGREGGRQKMWMFTGRRVFEVETPLLDEGEIIAFKIAPSGARIALVRTAPGGTELGLARIIRTDKVSVNGWRPITTAQSDNKQVARIADVAWIDTTELMLLSAANLNASLVLTRIRDDASQVTPLAGEPSDWDARDITMLMRAKATIVHGANGEAWRNDGSQWLPFLKNITAIAYPG